STKCWTTFTPITRRIDISKRGRLQDKESPHDVGISDKIQGTDVFSGPQRIEDPVPELPVRVFLDPVGTLGAHGDLHPGVRVPGQSEQGAAGGGLSPVCTVRTHSLDLFQQFRAERDQGPLQQRLPNQKSVFSSGDFSLDHVDLQPGQLHPGLWTDYGDGGGYPAVDSVGSTGVAARNHS